MSAEQARLVEAAAANLTDLDRSVDESVQQDLGYAPEQILCRTALNGMIEASAEETSTSSGAHDQDELTPEEEREIDRLDSQGRSSYAMNRAEVISRR
jgi:hypothetical protein